MNHLAILSFFSSHMQLKFVDRLRSPQATTQWNSLSHRVFHEYLYPINLKMESSETILTYALPKQKTFDWMLQMTYKNINITSIY